MGRKYVYWFNELRREYNELVGKKCANLGEIARLGMPVPPGFALAVDAYNTFMVETSAAEEISQYLTRFPGGLQSVADFQKASKDIRQIVDSKRMPKDIEQAVLLSYDALCQKCDAADVAVSVRSAGPKSHPGQYETYLNVRGKKALIEKIIKVWSSTFVSRALSSRANEGLPLHTDPIGVAVLKMVNAKSAGIGFTANPNTGDMSQIIIEGSWGLGETVVGGVVNPDRYVIDKNTLEVIERTIGHKLLKITSQEKGTVEEEVPPGEQDVSCLTDEELLEIARLAKELESRFGEPQDMEWAIDSALRFPQNVFLLQTRPVVVAKRTSPIDKAIDKLMDMMDRQGFGQRQRF